MSMPRSASRSDLDGAPRKKLIVGGVSAVLLVVMIIGTAAFFLSDRSDADDLSSRSMRKATRTVDMFCSPTDFQATCRETLEGALAKQTDPSAQPHAAAAAAVTAVGRELASGFSRSSALEVVRRSNDTLVQEALRDCRMLLDDCTADLTRALTSIAWRGVDGPAKDLQAWLSAVITFQGSCTDMFPKGAVRDQVKDTMRKAWEMSSNAIAIIQQGAALAAMLDLDAGAVPVPAAAETNDGGRKLLPVPSWVPHEERRLLDDEEQSTAALRPNVTVAKDGSGDFANISAALDALPRNYLGRYVIYIKEGVYDETVNVTNRMHNVTMYGDGAEKTIITGSHSVADGMRMWRTATVAVDGDRFMAMNLGIRNTAGNAKNQALALRVKGDRAIFFKCRLDGHQDTLLAQAYRQFYRSCVISGTIDFIFGDAAAVFQRCLVLVRRPLPGKPAVITAHGRRDRQQTTGFVLHRTRIVADDDLAANGSSPPVKAYLGRPWKDFARTVVMESIIDGFVHAEGYMPWEGKEDVGTAFFGEFRNVGDGAKVAGRTAKGKGVHVLAKDYAMQFTVERFLNGAEWIPDSGTPVRLGMFG